MAIYAFIIIAVILVGLTKNWNSTEKKKLKYIRIVFALMIIVAALRSQNVGIDLRNQYSKFFYYISQMNWSQWRQLRFEWGYFAFCKLLSYISSDVQILIIGSTLVSFICTGYSIYRNSKDVVMSTVLFICMNQMFLYYTGLRQVLALSIILLGLETLKKNKYVIFALIVAVASLFHSSAWIALLFLVFHLVKFKRKGILLSIAGTTVVLFFYQQLYNSALSIFVKYQEYSIGGTSERFFTGSVNGYSIITVLISALIFVIALFNLYYNKEQRGDVTEVQSTSQEINGATFSNDFLLYGSLFAMLFQMFVFTVNILTRFRYYFIPISYIALPAAIDMMSRRNKKVVRNVTFAVLVIYFLYGCANFAENLWGVVPYEFFFSK